MPIYEFQCDRCGEVFESIYHSDPPHKLRCHRDGCRGHAHKILSVFSGPEQMRGMQALAGGQKFVRTRRDWRNKVDEGKITRPPT